MDLEKFVEKFKKRMLVVLDSNYGSVDETDINVEDFCYYMKADREIEIFGVLFEFFFRPETNEVKVISLALRQLLEYDLEAVFTENTVIKQIDDYINDSLIELNEDECSSLLTEKRVQNTTQLLKGEYENIMVHSNEKWNPKTKILEKY